MFKKKDLELKEEAAEIQHLKLFSAATTTIVEF